LCGFEAGASEFASIVYRHHASKSALTSKSTIINPQSKMNPHSPLPNPKSSKALADQREDWRRFVAALAQVAGVKYAQ
jgi:hypothetical protein